MYRVDLPTKERWIYVSFDEWDTEGPDSFIKLVKAYEHQLGGKIIEVSDDMQYEIDNDSLKLIFQWDGCFGITVVVPNTSNLMEAYNTLLNLCESLNKDITKRT